MGGRGGFVSAVQAAQLQCFVTVHAPEADGHPCNVPGPDDAPPNLDRRASQTLATMLAAPSDPPTVVFDVD